MNLINFAHGMILVFAGYGMALVSDGNILVLTLASVAAAVLISLAMGYFAFRPFL